MGLSPETQPLSPPPVDDVAPPGPSRGGVLVQSGQGYQPSGPPLFMSPVGAPPPLYAPVQGIPIVQLAPRPVSGIPIRAPRVHPAPGQVLLGYEVYRPAPGCCMCDGMSPMGLLSVVILLLFCWPLAWIPCMLPDAFETIQRPVYGWPAAGGGHMQPPPPPPYGYAGYPPPAAAPPQQQHQYAPGYATL